MTKEEFETQYCENSGIEPELYHSAFLTLPCSCDYENCKGWAAVTRNPLVIAEHLSRNPLDTSSSGMAATVKLIADGYL